MEAVHDMKNLLAIIASLFIVACTPPAQIVRTQTVEVSKYIRVPIPAQLTAPTIVIDPAPACGSTFCNGQIATMLGDYRSGLFQCNADKAALRELDALPTGKTPSAGTGEPVPAPAYYGDDDFIPTTARVASPGQWDMRGKRESRAARTRALPQGTR
jgi:hypothetical protein